MTADEIATLLKSLPLEQAARILLVITPGLAGAALASKVLSHELSSIMLHAMSTGTIPSSEDHAHLLSAVAKETHAKVKKGSHH
jgi:hypothetical protein